MQRARQLAVRLLAWMRRDESERALAKEIAAHLAMLEEAFREQGLSADEAKFAARRAFGGIEHSKEAYGDGRGLVAIEQFMQDARHAARSLWKRPGFALVAVLSLAFGIGVNTAIFTLVNGILLRKLPIPEADRVVQLGSHGKAWHSGH